MDDLPKELETKIEETYVRATYDNIAEEFSGTRYKKWPKVDEFLQSLPKGSILLDVGCGNGKYLNNVGTINIGCDISLNLLSICREKKFEVSHCDMMNLPYKAGSFDAIICIAALHHIASPQRRKKCIESMIELLATENSKLFVQVWSYEQELNSNNPYLSKSKAKSIPEEQMKVLEIDSIRLPIHKNRTPFQNQDLLVPFKLKQKLSSSETDSDQHNLRFYHVFKQGELDELIGRVQHAKIIESFYDKGNWCSIVTREASENERQRVY